MRVSVWGKEEMESVQDRGRRHAKEQRLPATQRALRCDGMASKVKDNLLMDVSGWSQEEKGGRPTVTRKRKELVFDSQSV